MNTLNARQLFRNAWRLAAFLAVIFAAAGIRAQGQPVPAQGQQQQQAARFLIIFETSPVMKKNLPIIKDMMGEMFSGNLQNEMKTGDDLAVWTVDDQLHTGTFPLENWSPDEAAEYAGRLNDFLGKQKYRRSATLSAVQPLLDHVVKNSERLTVLIFCDSQSHLTGTPYDDGVNDIITNAAAKLQGGPKPFILVLRSYHGEYLGCSVNRSGLLNFPKFPAPPKPQPPPVVKEAPAPPPPVTPATGPAVTPIQALIIVGTNASTNASAALKPPATTVTIPPPQPTVAPAVVTTPAPVPAPQPVANPPAPTPPPAVTPAPTTPASIILSGPPPKPAPKPAPVPPPQNVAPAPTTPAPETQVATTPAPVTPAAPETTPATNPATTATESNTTDTGYVWPLVIAGAAIVLAIIIVLWLVMRGRRPQGSLITSSMADDPRLPPRK